MKEQPQFTAYKTARDRDPDGDMGEHFDHGGFDTVHGMLPNAVTDRSPCQAQKLAPASPVEYAVEGNTITIPSWPSIAPIKQRVGRRLATSVVATASPERRVLVNWRCDCGNTGRMQVSHWRREDSVQCSRCSRRGIGNTMPEARSPMFKCAKPSWQDPMPFYEERRRA